MTMLPLIDNPVDSDTLNSSQDAKVQEVFGKLAIDKRRLPASQLQKRGVPAYVGEWLLESIAPGRGPLSRRDAESVLAWAEKNIPGPGEQRYVKFRLSEGETVRLLS